MVVAHAVGTGGGSNVRKGDGDLVERSRHLGYFQQHGQVYAYHDLFGYLLSMSPDVVELLEYHHEAPRTRAQAEEAFAGRFEEGQLDEFLAVLELFSCLVEPGAREEDRLPDMVPVRARWVVTHQPAEDRLTFWRTDRAGVSSADSAPPWAARLWARIDGERTLRAIVAEIASDPSLASEPSPEQAVLSLVASWVHHDRQYLRFSKVPVSRYGQEHQWPSYLRSSMPFAPYDPAGDAPPRDPFDDVGVPIEPPHGYYEGEVDDAAHQFRDVETTLSHLFRAPSPILGGATYAQRVVAALVDRGYAGPSTRHILEVGAGTGDFAAGVLLELRKRFPDTFADVRYTILDLSPALRAAQAERLAKAGLADHVTWREGNAETVALPSSSFDLVLCNEVVGDFTTVKLTRELLGLAEDAPAEEAYQRWDEARMERLGEAGEIIRRFAIPLEDAPDDFFLNVGALRFVQNLYRVVEPGGAAYITEYGERLRYPVASTHLDHLEFSIHFGHLMHVAGEAGFLTELEYVQDLIGMDRSAETLATTRTFFTTLRAMLQSFGIELDKRAYTRKMLTELLGTALRLEDIGDLRFHPVDERCMGLSPHEFKALLLRRPGAVEV